MPKRETLAEAELAERVGWLIRLRWAAAAALAAAVLAGMAIPSIHLEPIGPLGIAAAIALYNVAFARAARRLAREPGRLATLRRFANLQIALDLAALATLVGLTGGIRNPMAPFFVFHMIIASILLSRRASFLQATWAALLVATLGTLEATGAARFRRLFDPAIREGAAGDPLGPLVWSAATILTILVCVYMATSITARLREREGRLAEANAMLRRADRTRSEYVLRVAHDIRGHLAAIQSCLSVVLQGFIGGLPEGPRGMIARAESRTRAVLHFVRDLLDLSRIRATADLRFESIALAPIIQWCLESMHITPTQKRIQLVADIPLSASRIRGDRGQIQELFLNLVTNAVKYTPEGGEVIVRSRALDARWILVEVEDTGIGIPPEAGEAIFEEFYRAPEAREIVREGTGLGLAIVRQIVKSHGGRIEYESEVGKGTRFRITLPRPLPEEAEATARGANGAAGKEGDG